MEVEIVRAGPQQTPFTFANAEKVGEIQIDEKEAELWKAGQEVTVNDVQYRVAKRLFPEPGIVSLWI